ncbi:MAG: glycoside hydrolase family 2 TIM barrel-domain containing protein [Chitinophagaceae bacterium]
MKKNLIFILSILLSQVSHAVPRTILDFNKDWKFYLGDDSTASKAPYNDASWHNLSLPHDWSIELNFSEKAPATTQGGALPGGIGWYRKTFTVPVASKNKNVAIEFEGVYRNSEVWINGHYLGKRPNGYISFRYELSPWLKYGAEKNIIAVKVDNSAQPNSRWYSGSGIYRNVRLITTNKVGFDATETFVHPWYISGNLGETSEGGMLKPGQIIAIVPVSVTLHNQTGVSQKLRLVHTVYDAAGKVAGKPFSGDIELDTFGVINRLDPGLYIDNPRLWSLEHPYLYKVVSALYQNNQLVDEVTTITGIRKIHFDRKKGFFLNDMPLKIKGVCMHHDLGALGSAFNYRAAERQLEILKAMGCNAIRTSHNPPAPEFLDLCDKMGFLVMDEAFDMWQKKKNKFDYYLDFKQWHQLDLEDMVKRDRNHPSVFIWSIGNEIREQFDSSGTALTKELAAIVKRLDPTRPVTSALTETDTAKNFIYQSGEALDVLGWNYNQQKYPDALASYPGKIFIASETTSALETRGVYNMPSDSIQVWPPKGKKEMEDVNGDWSVSAYDNVKSNWGSTHEETWKIIKKYDFLSGMFVWTGFDYLGEPTPFPWPARSSYFGIVDLAGFPKDVYYMYQSEWTTKPVLHLFPHWNWRPGQLVNIWAYYNNADEVELYLNGRSLGTRKKTGDDLHVMWRVPFTPGILKAVSRRNGRMVLTKEIRTAGQPVKIELKADRSIVKAGGKDLSFVTVRILDKDGNLVPDADQLLRFSVSGPGIIVATDNGYQADTTSFTSNQRKAWKGMALAIVKSAGKKGNITLKASIAGLLTSLLTLKALN